MGMIIIKDTETVDNNQSVSLTSPWITYYRKVGALFDKDPEIDVIFDEDDLTLRLQVDNSDKADALTQLLPDHVIFGNVRLNVSVIPANKTMTRTDYIKAAFKGNPAVSTIEVIDDPTLSNTMTFVEMEPVVCQFYTDNIHDIHGLTSTLYEDLAREIVGEGEGIFFTTDKLED